MSTEKKATTSNAIDVKDVSFGDFLSVLKRLKISSIIWIIGIAATAFISVIGFIRTTDNNILNSRINLYQDSLKNSRHGLDSINSFQNFYTLRFTNKNTLQKIVPAIIDEHPDGIKTYKEAMQCLLYQVRSQKGFAEFLKDSVSVVLKLMPDSAAINFDWQKRPNVLLRIFQNLHLDVSASELTQCNAELNFFGMTWLSDGSTVVRDYTGGLEVVN